MSARLKSPATLIAECKEALGNPRLSDTELGKVLGFSQPTVADYKAGRCSPRVALAIGELLTRAGKVDHPGAVVLSSYAQHASQRGRVRSTLCDYLRRRGIGTT